MKNVHEITKEFENKLSEYTGAPYVICLDNQSNGMFLSLYYEKNILKNNKLNTIYIPQHTYPSAPCAIIHCGSKVEFERSTPILTGAYQLYPSNVYDSALKFTSDMYIPGTHMCVSFTGPYKHLKLSKGGAILTDNKKAYEWFKKARFSGRSECSYHDDNFDNNPVIGWNFYMMPEIAARGILLLQQFYDIDGNKLHNEDLSIKYPNLSKFKCYDI
jgi:dTDP-4-amino-4,6-dideoxygalactose transaminase